MELVTHPLWYVTAWRHINMHIYMYMQHGLLHAPFATSRNKSFMSNCWQAKRSSSLKFQFHNNSFTCDVDDVEDNQRWYIHRRTCVCRKHIGCCGRRIKWRSRRRHTTAIQRSWAGANRQTASGRRQHVSRAMVLRLKRHCCKLAVRTIVTTTFCCMYCMPHMMDTAFFVVLWLLFTILLCLAPTRLQPHACRLCLSNILTLCNKFLCRYIAHARPI